MVKLYQTFTCDLSQEVLKRNTISILFRFIVKEMKNWRMDRR